MTENTALNALYRQYEDEKRRLELYGHVNSLTYEEWLECKKNNQQTLFQSWTKNNYFAKYANGAKTTQRT